MSLTAKQLEARKIGGSDDATILGLNPYMTAEELRLTILGRLAPFEGNEATDAGEIMEEGIRLLYAKRTGRTVNRSHTTLVHPKHEWLTAHIDGRIVGHRIGLECKNVHWRMAKDWGEQGTDQVAEYYLPQVMHYMLVLDYQQWDVAAFFGGSDLRIYTVERDKEWDQLIIDATHAFYYTNVLQDVPCEIDNTRPRAIEALRRIYPGTDGSTLVASESIAQVHAVYQQFKTLEKEYETAADVAKAHILREMGDAALLELPDGSHYTRKIVQRKGFTVEPTSYVDFRHAKSKSRIINESQERIEHHE